MAELKRGFGYWTVLCISIGSIIGTAIFFGASIGAQYSGSLTIVSWIILSFISIYIAMCFGELTSMFPKSGGTYEFSKQAYGRFISFITGWSSWLVGNIAVVVLIVASTDLLLPAINLPNAQLAKPIIAIALILLFNLIALIGIEATSIMTIGFAVVIIGVIFTIIAKGSTTAAISNIAIGNVAPLSIFVTIFFLLETYFGWEAATYLAEETKDARKIIPKAIIYATIIIAFLGLGMLIVTFGNIPLNELKGLESPTTALANKIFGSAGGLIAIAGIIVALLGSAASGIITLPRLTLAMARDKLLFEQLTAIHPTFKTPYKAIIFQAIMTSILLFMGFGNYTILLSILVPLAIMMYVPIILAVPILRAKSPEVERPFKAPMGKIMPIAVAIFLIASMLIATSNITKGIVLLNLSISLIVLGLPLFLLFELYYDPKMITNINDIFSHISLLTENLSYPKAIRKEILSFIGDIKGKTVLEFGCGVGTMTMRLLKEVGPKGAVYATHFSKNDLKIAGKRIEQKKWETEGYVYGSAKLIHDPQQFYRVHPEVSRVDVIVSVGMMGYMQDIKSILRDMRQILSPGGRICFVEYSDFMHILPSVGWLGDDKKIEELFNEAGFSVRVTRTKSLFWNRIFIYGIKYKGIVMI